MWEISVAAADNFHVEMNSKMVYSRGFMIRNQALTSELKDSYDIYQYEDGAKTLSITKPNTITYIGMGYYSNYAIVETKDVESIYTIEKLIFD